MAEKKKAATAKKKPAKKPAKKRRKKIPIPKVEALVDPLEMAEAKVEILEKAAKAEAPEKKKGKSFISKVVNVLEDVAEEIILRKIRGVSKHSNLDPNIAGSGKRHFGKIADATFGGTRRG